MSTHVVFAVDPVNWFTGWKFAGHFTKVDLIAASTNSLNGALLARRPDHLWIVARYRAWEEPLAKEPAGVYQHSDGRPLLGRKLAGKSQRELRDLGLLVENGAQAQPASRPETTRKAVV